MRLLRVFLVPFCLVTAALPSGAEPLQPPVAERRPHSFTHHGITVEDPYHWLKDPGYPEVTDPDVLDYLKAENAYFDQEMAPYQSLKDTIFAELKGRLKEDDEQVPYKKGDWLYQWRFEDGAQYRRWYRRPVAGGEEELLLDEPALAAGLDYFRLGAMALSPDGTKLAWSVDDDGSERFTLRIKDIVSGKVYEEAIDQTIGSIVWANDNQTLFYTRVNENWRPYLVKAHRLGSDPATDRDIYQERDEGFFVGIGKTLSERFITIASGDHETSEVWLIDADTPEVAPRLVAARRAGHEYSVDHGEDGLYILTNDAHENFRLVRADVDAPGEDNWVEVIAGSDRDYLTGIQPFKDFLVIAGRRNGLDQLWVQTYTGARHAIAFPEEAYDAGLGSNAEYETGTLRLGYDSMITPPTVYDYDVAARTLTTLKVQEIPSGYDKAKYRTERLVATARDGAKVPVSIVYPADYQKGGTAPLHLYAYGAYGHGLSPSFSTARLSLLDRGFAYAIAHIRGGDELGRGWYKAGKRFKRTNTFNDFVDVARFLVDAGWTQAGHISISGGSAGGELMGAVLNQAPTLWAGAAAHVPFVDVLNTMLDTSLPLTPIEWPEWGNPIEDKAAFDYIRSYSPYDQVEAKAYPPILITGGLNDPRVTYWEPAKWAARLRHLKTDDNLLLLKTNMGAGHGGKSGRYTRLEEVAEEYVFLLRAHGLTTGGAS